MNESWPLPLVKLFRKRAFTDVWEIAYEVTFLPTFQNTEEEAQGIDQSTLH